MTRKRTSLLHGTRRLAHGGVAGAHDEWTIPADGLLILRSRVDIRSSENRKLQDVGALAATVQ